MNVLNELTGTLLKERWHRFRRIGLYLGALFVVSIGLGAILQSVGSSGLSELLSGLAIEIAGALLTFWLIDYVWQSSEETHQAGVELSRRMMILTFKVKKYNELVREAEAEFKGQGKADPKKVAELRSFKREIDADFNSALNFSVPYMKAISEEIREAAYQQSKNVPKTERANSS